MVCVKVAWGIELLHHHLLKNCLFSCICPFVKTTATTTTTQLSINVCICFWTFYSSTLIYLFIFMSTPYCLATFIIIFEIKKFYSYHFFLLLQIFLGFLGLFHSHISFKISFSISLKACWHFYWDYIESINQFGENWHLKNIECSDLWKQYFSPFIYIFNFCHKCFMDSAYRCMKYFIRIICNYVILEAIINSLVYIILISNCWYIDWVLYIVPVYLTLLNSLFLNLFWR